MKFYTVLFLVLLFFGCIDRLFAPDGNGDGLQLPEEQDPEIPKSSELVTETSLQSESSNDGIHADQGHPSLLSSVSEFEEVVTPTIAPATPTYDVELSFATDLADPSSIVPHLQQTDTAHASVILIPPNHPFQVQSSENNQVAEGIIASEALPTTAPNVVSSVLDSSPKSSIDGEPMPTPPTVRGAKDEEDSITAALTQADEESKPKQEEMPSFDEFKRRVLNSSGIPQKPKLRRIKERKQSNYASMDCGAKILESNPEASNAESVLVENKDLYMLNPCSAKIWFIVELCDLAQVKNIQIANFELFSSTPESFRVYVSQRYPTRDWTMLGTFQAREEREIQSFPLDEPIYAKYAKIDMLSHFGTEHYCPLSLLRVYGSSMMEELEDHERDGQEDMDSLDSDSDDTMQVLPPEPGAETKKEPPEQNIFERAADTVLSFVKKFTGSAQEKENGTLNSSDPKSKVIGENAGQSKQSIVTLMGHEEPEEKEEANNTVPSPQSGDTSGEKSEAVPTSHKETLSCEETEDEITETVCFALTPCQLFVNVIGHSSLHCLMGRLLFYKKENHNFTAVGEKMKFENLKTSKELAYNKSHISRKDEIQHYSESNGKVDSLDQERDVEEKVQTIERITSSLEETVTTSSSASLRPSSSSIEKKSQVQETVASPLRGEAVVDVSLGIVKPIHSLENVFTSSSEEYDKKTPLLPSISVVASNQENSTPLLSPSLVSQSRVMPVLEESDANIQDLPSKNTQGFKEASLQQPNSHIVELHYEVKPSENQDVPFHGVPSVSNVVSTDEEQERDKVSDQPNEAAEVSTKHQVSQSESKTPNSLGMMSEASPDIDILETKLTDSEGREGMAQLPKAYSYSKNTEGEKLELEHVVDSSVEQESVETESEVTLVITSSARTLNHVASTSILESQSMESAINPAKSSIGASDVADSILPLAAPPVVTDASVNSQDIPSSSDAVSFDAVSLSKVQQGAAASSAGGMAAGSSSGTHKESIFVRLSNKIKALEQNLNMSTLYMEQLNQRYRKSLDEMQKNVDKKVALLTNATKKAELVINGQKEQISKLQSMVDNLTNLVTDMKSRMDFLNKEVMERHIIGLFIEVILILLLFTIFRRRYFTQAVHVMETPRDPVHLTNGHGPPRLANEITTAPRVPLSGREQLLRSFGKTPEPEVVGASMSTDACNSKQNIKPEPCAVEGKKKRSRRGSKQANRPDPPPDSPVSLTSRTAGLLFFSARGLLGGLANPKKARKTPTTYVESVTSERSCFGGAETSKKAACMTGATSLEIVPERTVPKKPPPPPPPPPPDYSNIKKSNAHSIARGPMKYGKYGVLDTQLA